MLSMYVANHLLDEEATLPFYGRILMDGKAMQELVFGHYNVGE